MMCSGVRNAKKEVLKIKAGWLFVEIVLLLGHHVCFLSLLSKKVKLLMGKSVKRSLVKYRMFCNAVRGEF